MDSRYLIYEFAAFLRGDCRTRSWNLSFPPNHLFPDRLPVSPCVRPLSYQKLVSDHPHSVEISGEGVVLTEKNLRRHVARGSAGLLRVFWPPVPGDAQVSDFGVAFAVEDDVLRLDVPVDDVLAVQAPQPLQQATHQKP